MVRLLSDKEIAFRHDKGVYTFRCVGCGSVIVATRRSVALKTGFCGDCMAAGV